MDANSYKIVCDWIEHAEGGYVDNPQDPGGATKYGISQTSFPNLDIANITIDDAMNIYNKQYWQPLQLDNYPLPISLFLFDTAVLQGVGKAVELINRVNIDVNDVKGTILKLIPMRLWVLALVSDYGTFGRGWTNRIADLINVINENLKEG